ncbi:hypothetical protein Hanom_Chr12g01169451 [Helianthus anomalus]
MVSQVEWEVAYKTQVEAFINLRRLIKQRRSNLWCVMRSDILIKYSFNFTCIMLLFYYSLSIFCNLYSLVLNNIIQFFLTKIQFTIFFHGRVSILRGSHNLKDLFVVLSKSINAVL